jgi:hypothetical protein
VVDRVGSVGIGSPAGIGPGRGTCCDRSKTGNLLGSVPNSSSIFVNSYQTDVIIFDP